MDIKTWVQSSNCSVFAQVIVPLIFFSLTILVLIIKKTYMNLNTKFNYALCVIENSLTTSESLSNPFFVFITWRLQAYLLSVGILEVVSVTVMVTIFVDMFWIRSKTELQRVKENFRLPVFVQSERRTHPVTSELKINWKSVR